MAPPMRDQVSRPSRITTAPTGAEVAHRATGPFRQLVIDQHFLDGTVLHSHLDTNSPTAGDYQVVAVGTDNVNYASGVEHVDPCHG